MCVEQSSETDVILKISEIITVILCKNIIEFPRVVGNK